MAAPTRRQPRTITPSSTSVSRRGTAQRCAHSSRNHAQGNQVQVCPTRIKCGVVQQNCTTIGCRQAQQAVLGPRPRVQSPAAGMPKQRLAFQRRDVTLLDHNDRNVCHFIMMSECIDCRLRALIASQVWVRPFVNFDNLAISAFVLFQMSTTENWGPVMFSGGWVVGPDRQPRFGHNHWIQLYFVAFIIVGAFLLSKLIVGVTIDKVRPSCC